MKLDGMLSSEQVSQLWRQRETLFRESELDLADLSQVDAAGLAFLVHWAKAQQKQASRLHLKNIPEQLRRLIQLYSVEPLFELSLS